MEVTPPYVPPVVPKVEPAVESSDASSGVADLNAVQQSGAATNNNITNSHSCYDLFSDDDGQEELQQHSFLSVMSTLSDMELLKGEVIDKYMSIICERSTNTPALPRVYALDTVFFPKFQLEGHKAVERWTNKVDIFSYPLLFIPIHRYLDKQPHWSLAIVDFANKHIDYYDSLRAKYPLCSDVIRKYLSDEHLLRKKTEFDWSGWNNSTRTVIPHQTNDSDCGVFISQYAEFSSRRAPLTFNQEDMPYYRRRMHIEICKKRLLNNKNVPIDAIDERECPSCEKAFTEDLDKDDGEWKLNDSVLKDGKPYHRMCLELDVEMETTDENGGASGGRKSKREAVELGNKWDRKEVAVAFTEEEAEERPRRSPMKYYHRRKSSRDQQHEEREKEKSKENEEERRKTLREIEVKVMKLQDELKAKNAENIDHELAKYRKTLMAKMDEKLLSKSSKEAKKEKEKRDRDRGGRHDQDSRDRKRSHDRLECAVRQSRLHPVSASANLASRPPQSICAVRPGPVAELRRGGQARQSALALCAELQPEAHYDANRAQLASGCHSSGDGRHALAESAVRDAESSDHLLAAGDHVDVRYPAPDGRLSPLPRAATRPERAPGTDSPLPL